MQSYYDDKSGLAYYWLEENIGRALLILVFSWVGLWGLMLEGRVDLDRGRLFVRGMGPELAGIVLAVLTVDAIAERRLDRERKRILINQLGSAYREITETAIIELTHRKWLFDGTLKGAFLTSANLSRANLFGANLSKSHLSTANLKDAFLPLANLSGADLQLSSLNGAYLRSANLSSARLVQTNLSKANLQLSDLSGTYLFEANFSEADLGEANLIGAKYWTISQIAEAKIFDGVIMPDNVQLGRQKTPVHEYIHGPTFQEWKLKYIAKYGGTESDIRLA